MIGVGNSFRLGVTFTCAGSFSAYDGVAGSHASQGSFPPVILNSRLFCRAAANCLDVLSQLLSNEE